VRLFSNTRIYDRVGGLYDAALGFWSREVRRQAAGAFDLREGERLLIVGVGTGMELEHLPAWVRGAGVDLSAGMLARARRRRAEFGMQDLDLRMMDARTLDYPGESFDAVYLPLILTVVEDGARVLAEAARVAAPGGRIVVADRFWPEERSRPAAARAASWILGHFAMRFDRRLSKIRSGAPTL
jgi:phosphatidylethanolamine/phosphatidyl-N-methylethanolamine N-methyltransferase